jgi:hypothetical protein
MWMIYRNITINTRMDKIFLAGGWAGMWEKGAGDQLPLAPPVLMGFLTAPAALELGLAMNLEPPWGPCLAFLLPGLFFLSLIWNPMVRVFINLRQFPQLA